jgi:peptidoglycan/xylan/chitin deacetylase (PgdA/CDA1 family)
MATGGAMRRIRRGAAPVAKRVLFGIGAYGAVRSVRPSRGLAILRYHAVCGPEGDAYAESGIRVTPASFEQHVAYLTSRYHVMSLPEAARCLRDNRPLPANAVAITFDDGYADNFAAAHILGRYGATATFYITAGCMAGEAPFWPAELRGLLARIEAPDVRLTSAGAAVVVPLRTATDRRAATRTISRLFKSHPIPIREALREELRRQARGVARDSPMLTWSHLREMHRMGMTIGAHTVTHPNLPSAGAADARREISESRARLERELDTPVTMFSYPNGGAERYLTPEIVTMVREAGYEAATTSRNGVAGYGSDVFALERVQVPERVEDLAFALEIERFVFKPRPRVAEEASGR